MKNWMKIIISVMKLIFSMLGIFGITAILTLFVFNGIGHLPFSLWVNLIVPALASIVVMGQIIAMVCEDYDTIEMNQKDLANEQKENYQSKGDVVHTKQIVPVNTPNVYSSGEAEFSDLQQSLNNAILNSVQNQTNIPDETLDSEKKLLLKRYH